MQAQRRLILAVDADPAFLDDARLLLDGQRVLTARSVDEAAEIVPGGRVGLVILGPSLGSETGIDSAAVLHHHDPTLPVVLVANVITNRMLLAGMRSGFSDVVDTPLTIRKVEAILARARTSAPAAAGNTPTAEDPVDVVVEFEATSGPAVASSFEAGSGEAEGGSPIEVELPTPPAPTPKPPPTAEHLFAPDPDWDEAATTPGDMQPQTPVADPSEPSSSPQTVEHATPGPIEELPPVATYDPGPFVQKPSRPVEPVAADPVALESPVAIEPAIAQNPMTSVPAPEPVTPPPAELPPPPTRAGEPIPPMPSSPPPTEDRTVVHPASDDPVEPPVSPSRVSAPPVPRPMGSGRVIAVMAGKGGSGKTVTATNLAMSLTMQYGEDSVAIVDADLQFGDVALLLQLDPARTIVDVARRVDDLSDAKLESMLLRHPSGLRVLPAPVLPTSEEEVPAKVIARILDRLRSLHRVVVVDTPPIFDDHLVTTLEQADEVFVVVDMDLPSVKNAKIALDALRGSGFDMGRLRLVVNRANAKARLDVVELERSLGLRVAGSIPSDRLVPQSVNEGVPVVALSPRSRVARAFHALAGIVEVAEGGT